MREDVGVTEDQKLFGLVQTSTWIVATAFAVAGGTAYCYRTFLTKEEYYSRREEGLARLGRMEEKIDRLIERTNKGR